MKKRVLFAIIICFASVNMSLFAQRDDDRKKEKFEKFKAERTEFISKAMNLTEEEKKDFWPLCDELQMKKFELNKPLREEIHKILKARKADQTVTEADYKKVMELSAQIKVKEAQLEQEYYTKFLKVITAEKLFLYQRAEQQFGKNVMEKRDRNKKD
jgi:Spy/CpxP family protein refolding chaperone